MRCVLRANERNRALLDRFWYDQAGSYLIITGLMMPVIVGCVALAADYGLWLHTRQSMQGAADSAAISAATASITDNPLTQARAVTASYGFVSGANGVTVTVNRPPQSGTHTTTTGAVEVILQKPQPPAFSVVLGSQSFTIAARAVAVPIGGSGCVLALNKTASGAVTVQGGAQVVLDSCNLYDDPTSGSALTVGGSATLSALTVGVVGNISGTSSVTATKGIATGLLPLSDPYANVPLPSFSGCDEHNYTAKTTVTIDPGVYCGGISVIAGATLTLNPGIYFLDRGNLSAVGSSAITGTGVTLVFTSSTGSNYATASITGNAIVNLTAPTSGPTAGIVIFGDRAMPVGTSFKLTGGGSQVFGGAIYVPKGALEFSGGNSTGSSCTQIVADTISLSGNSSLKLDCNGFGTKPIGSAAGKLVE